jgi:predicted nucleotidyltransferase
MKKSLSHLPKDKQNELRLIVEKIRERIEPQMLILFGSYARGNWVEDTYLEDGVTYEYRSDYDILVIVKSVKIADSYDLLLGLTNRAAVPAQGLSLSPINARR